MRREYVVLPLSLSLLTRADCGAVGAARAAAGEYVTRNDELLAGDARQALMRDDSVKLDKRIWAERELQVCERGTGGREGQGKCEGDREVCACALAKPDNDNAP